MTISHLPTFSSIVVFDCTDLNFIIHITLAVTSFFIATFLTFVFSYLFPSFCVLVMLFLPLCKGLLRLSKCTATLTRGGKGCVIKSFALFCLYSLYML